jgi:uncharacterized protein (TIGR03437 family)
MQRKRKILIGKIAAILGVIPVLIWAHSAGPDVGKAGVPGESTCNEAQCHVGTALNGGGGNVAITFPGDATYVPGVKQHLVITITDSAQKRWGFQLAARLFSNSKIQAGSFSSTDANTAVVCGATATDPGETFLDFGKSQACPAAKPLAYAEHTLTGSSRIKAGSQTYELDWTPPSTDVGNIVVYAAGNAANGNGDERGDHIYTKTYILTPATSGGGSTPALTKVASASGFGGFSSIAPGTWVEISGANLNSNTRAWAGADFSGSTAPTSLDGTKVTVGGQPAFTYYISPTQVNALIPGNVATGTQQLTVTNGSNTSSNLPVTVAALQPGLLALPQAPWLNGTKQYVVAQSCDAGKTCALATDLNFILPAGTSIPGYPIRPAKPGETLTIYGIGFGPAIDSSNVNVPVGQIVSVANSLTNAVTMQVNGVPATLSYAGMAPGQVGLYQFNLVVPSVPDGDWPLTFTQNGTKSTQTLLLSVHQ